MLDFAELFRNSLVLISKIPSSQYCIFLFYLHHKITHFNKCCYKSYRIKNIFIFWTIWLSFAAHQAAC